MAILLLCIEEKSVSLQILILADESVEDSAIQADSRSLATLLLIRDIQVVSNDLQ